MKTIEGRLKEGQNKYYPLLRKFLTDYIIIIFHFLYYLFSDSHLAMTSIKTICILHS